MGQATTWRIIGVLIWALKPLVEPVSWTAARRRIHHLIVQRGQPLECDIGAKSIVEVGVEQLNLLLLDERMISTRKRHELAAKVIHRVGATEECQLTEGRISHWRPEPDVEDACELRPWRGAVIQLHAVEP
jgi:hypothetical protein